MYNRKGYTATNFLTVTEQKLINAGVVPDGYYNMKELSQKLHVARSSLSRLLSAFPFMESTESHHNPLIRGKIRTRMYSGNILLRYFKSRDEHFHKKNSEIRK